MRQMPVSRDIVGWSSFKAVTGKADGVANEIADREGSKTRKEAEEMPATGVDTTKIRVQNVNVHPHAYARTVQYEARER